MPQACKQQFPNYLVALINDITPAHRTLPTCTHLNSCTANAGCARAPSERRPQPRGVHKAEAAPPPHCPRTQPPSPAAATASVRRLAQILAPSGGNRLRLSRALPDELATELRP